MSKKESLRENVKVICRIRPQNQKEMATGGFQCVRHTQESVEVTTEDGAYNFTFDQIFGPESTQAAIFEYSAVPLIGDVLNGYNSTIFAYGQTSSGKTFTMEGPDIHDEQYKGIIPRTVEALFAGVSEADENIEFTFKVSYIEIYLEKVRDLLDSHRVKTNLQVREDKVKGIYIAGVTEEYVTSQEELLGIMSSGAMNRAVAATGMNEGSSRSHSVFTITISQRDVNTASTKSGKLVLVDLAGSEMVRKTNASGQQLEEAKTINKSLSALGQVIMALTDEKAQHIPYRDSKLTRILQDSLGGNSRTVLIVACSPSSYNAPETVSTMRFGMRAKSITNKVKVNQTRSVEELEDLLARAERAIDAQQAHIMTLSVQLQTAMEGGAVPGMVLSEGQSAARAETEAILIAQLQATISKLQTELEEEREESFRQGTEAEKLSALLSEKDRLLSEAGELMQEAQRHYESQRDRADQLVREAAEASGEMEVLRSQLGDADSKFRFEIEELLLELETVKKENDKLRIEISEMSGDSAEPMRKRDSHASAPGAAANTQESSPPPNVTQSNSMSQAIDLSAQESEHISLDGRFESKANAQHQLAELLRTLGLSAQVGVAIATWADAYSSENEYWFHVAEEKIAHSNYQNADAQKKIKDLKVQRQRLEDDLGTMTKKVFSRFYVKILTIFSYHNICIQAYDNRQEVEALLNSNGSVLGSEFIEKERVHTRCLQQRLEQLVTVHRQLLRKFTSLELENGELKKKISLRNERIKQLEVNARKMTSKLRIQIERHVSELTTLQENVSVSELQL